MNGSVALQLIKHYENTDAHARQGERLTDQAGRFPGGKSGEAGGMGYGENHNEKSETRKRLIERLAKSLNDLLEEEKFDGWFLAAPKEINQQVLDRLENGASALLKKNLSLDLTKAGKKELLERFC